MTEIIQCNKCRCEIPSDGYGVSTASHFTMEELQNGIWIRYRGHFCKSCKEEFLMWLGVKK